MAERVNVQVRVDREVWESFQSFVVETHGQKYGNLGREAENAFSEYIDRDRFARIEERLGAIEGQLDDLGSTRTHKQSETVEKAERITGEINNTGRIVIPSDEVRRAIETVAGGDDRTVRKYQGVLRRRGLAYEHPTDAVWTTDRDEYVKWALDHIDNNPTATIHDMIDGYPIDYGEIEQSATEVTA